MKRVFVIIDDYTLIVYVSESMAHSCNSYM